MNKPLLLIIVLSAILLAACGTSTPRPTDPVNISAAITDDGSGAWRSCRFRIAWPEEEPNWGVDLLLAHRIVGPAVTSFGNTLQRWRFHRRANRDEAGHQFTFMFYSSSSQAQDITAQIEQNPLREQLLEENILEFTECDSPSNTSKPLISDASDPNWPESIQKHWPSYIMGVSSLWLGLIDEAITSKGIEVTNVNGLIRLYNEANGTVTSLWQQYGEHAFLHHLSAVFGYEHLLIRY